MKLKNKLFFLIFVLVVILVVFSSVSFYMIGKNIIKKRVFAQLESVSTLKENSINQFIDENKNDIESIAQDKYFKENVVEHIIKYAFHGVHDENLHDLSRDYLIQKIKYHGSNVQELFIVDMHGSVHISTDKSQEGKIKTSEEYFKKGFSQTYLQNFFYDYSLQSPSMVISTPIVYEGVTKAVLVQRLNLSKINKIMTENSGLGETGETYLVNNINLMLTNSRFFENTAFKKSIYSKGVNECLQKKTYENIELDYRDIPVLGNYRWLSELDVCLVSEIETNEMYHDIYNLRNVVIFIDIIIMVIVLLSADIIIKRITKPLITLKSSAETIAKGKLNKKIEVQFGKDEIFDLANSFEKMRKSLMLRDSQLEKAVYELKEANKNLKNLDHAKSEFISIASHELRTPLTSVIGYIELLIKEKKLSKNPKKLNEILNITFEEAKRLHHLINDVLNLSKMESGKMTFNFKSNDILEVIESVYKESKILAEKKEIQLIKEISKVPKFIFDASKIEEAVSNIVNNAVKILAYGKKVKISLNRNEGFIDIVISDNGPGIPKDKMSELFKPFMQVESASKHHEGTGLGLAISKKIVEAHNGKILVKSELYKGTSFTIRLPETRGELNG